MNFNIKLQVLKVKWLAIFWLFYFSEHANKQWESWTRSEVRNKLHIRTNVQREQKQKAGRWNKMWCFIMEMTLCGVLCWIITSRCLGSQGLADIKACRVFGEAVAWRGRAGINASWLRLMAPGLGGCIHFTLSDSCSHSISVRKRVCLVCEWQCYFFCEIMSDQVWITHIFH